MGEFKVKQDREGNSLRLHLSGPVDEDTVFEGIQVEGANEVVIDLKDVSGVNSCGIREWIRWLKTIPEGAKLVYVNCPKLVVDQMNMVEGFFPRGSIVESFYVPYYCESCGEETLVSFEKGKEYDKNRLDVPEEVGCSKCGSETEIDVIEAKYFKFLELSE